MRKRLLRILTSVCIAVILFSFSGCSSAEEEQGGWKPSSSVNLIVPLAAGGGVDTLARAVAEYIDLDGQIMYVTNIEGGGGTIGIMEAYHSENDGLTLLIQSLEVCVVSYAAGTVEADLGNEMVWVSGLTKEPMALSVAADSPYETLEDMLTAAKEAPNTLTLAATGSASNNAAVQNLLRQTGAEITFVPYDGGNAKARAAVMGGHEDMLYCSWSDVKTYVESGDLRVLALSAEERVEIAPDVPTFHELGYDFFFYNTRSIMLPPETNEEIARYYEAKLKEVLENEEFQSAMRALGYNIVFTDMDNMQDKAVEAVAWAEEYVPLAMGQ